MGCFSHVERPCTLFMRMSCLVTGSLWLGKALTQRCVCFVRCVKKKKDLLLKSAWWTLDISQLLQSQTILGKQGKNSQLRPIIYCSNGSKPPNLLHGMKDFLEYQGGFHFSVCYLNLYNLHYEIGCELTCHTH